MDINIYRRVRDRKALLVALKETWALHAYFPDAKRPMLVYELFFDMALLASCWVDVAVVDGQPVGLLAGVLKHHQPVACRLYNFLASIAFYTKFAFILLTHQLGKPRFVLHQLREVYSLEAMCKLHKDPHDAQIELFYLHPKARGHGAGRALMKNFVAYAKTHRARSIALWTDISCSYTFYDNYGFSRDASFFSPILAEPEKGQDNGFVYTLKIEDKE
ncbi:GNAT family N-acetyltransferase [Entomospira culicis]|uniref:GNAT family N-acetyltransferase n=1 Tax=Entomospira culicis TaxID=2719989 RepID=A0A968KZB1_9SPIO|nr:GNAT family N-acetyltransferase [Entomospira culicis]NIZ18926.1 GNAT family N-acetyltransferase [Entomospira culicis]NIZ69141.1 GNAT family N-acetyltransferase [Entomospira culicis]WDI37727.1 GNAT family N-acetyltransferase [Entomospira culicis]WDI39355.1 GNAT family N-acetyltransferase [Entomospira culicis]